MNLAFYPTGHGYGHLTRLLAVAAAVQRFSPGTAIHLRAPHPLERALETLERPPESYAKVRLDIGLVAHDSLRFDPAASLAELARYYGPEGDALVEREAEWLAAAQIDAALLDIPPRGFDACHQAGVPAFGMTNFSWDDIWASLAGEQPGFERYAEAARETYHTARLLFRLPMHVGLTAFPRVEDVPFVARHSSFGRAEARQKLGLEQEERPLVLLAFGGEGLKGVTLPGAELRERFSIVTTQPMADPGGGVHHFLDRELREAGVSYPDLVRAADIVMSKPGYSTVAETVANGAGLVLTERSDFLEGPAILAYAREHLGCAVLSNEDLFAGNWGAALEEIAARLPLSTSLPTHGAEVVAKRLFEELG